MSWTVNKWLKPAWMGKDSDFMNKYQDKFTKLGDKFAPPNVKGTKKGNKKDDTIITMLQNVVKNDSVKKLAKQIWKSSFLDDDKVEEWCFIIVEQIVDTINEDDVTINTETRIIAKNERTDHEEGSVEPDYTIEPSYETLLGHYHTHPYIGKVVDIAFSAQDVWNMLNKDIQNYFSIIETKNKLFALVLTDVEKAKNYVSKTSREELIDDMAVHMQNQMKEHDQWDGDELFKEDVAYIVKGKGLRFYETIGIGKVDFFEV